MFFFSPGLTLAYEILVHMNQGLNLFPLQSGSGGRELPNLISYSIHNKHLPHGAYNVQFSVLDSQQSLFKLKKKSMK